jgi:calcineurin-like phosphoesterase family protein
MRYFIADTHFGHEKLIRPMLRCFPGTKTLFPTVEAHDTHLIDAINKTVGQDDELFVLGDFAQQPGKYRMRINCKHVRLVRGNHDPYQKSKNVFGEIPYIIHTKVRDGEGGSLKVVLCHTPMAYWDGSHNGSGHLYGHLHGQREDTLNAAFGHERRSMDVGADHLRRWQGHYSPVSEVNLYRLFTSWRGHDPVSFYHDYQETRDREFFA